MKQTPYIPDPDHETDSDAPFSVPPLHILTQMQELVISGLSVKEAEERCRSRELTEEEQAFMAKEAIKDLNKDMRALKRSVKKQNEEMMWAAISKKRGIGA